MRITAIRSGSEWNDAGIDFLVLPKEMDLNVEYTNYRLWYDTIYIPNYYNLTSKVEYKSFVAYLLEQGARYANEEELDDVHEDDLK